MPSCAIPTGILLAYYIKPFEIWQLFFCELFVNNPPFSKYAKNHFFSHNI